MLEGFKSWILMVAAAMNRAGTITSKLAPRLFLRCPYPDSSQEGAAHPREALLPSGSPSWKRPDRPTERHASVDCRSHQDDHQYQPSQHQRQKKSMKKGRFSGMIAGLALEASSIVALAPCFFTKPAMTVTSSRK